MSYFDDTYTFEQSKAKVEASVENILHNSSSDSSSVLRHYCEEDSGIESNTLLQDNSASLKCVIAAVDFCVVKSLLQSSSFLEQEKAGMWAALTELVDIRTVQAAVRIVDNHGVSYYYAETDPCRAVFQMSDPYYLNSDAAEMRRVSSLGDVPALKKEESRPKRPPRRVTFSANLPTLRGEKRKETDNEHDDDDDGEEATNEPVTAEGLINQFEDLQIGSPSKRTKWDRLSYCAHHPDHPGKMEEPIPKNLSNIERLRRLRKARADEIELCARLPQLYLSEDLTKLRTPLVLPPFIFGAIGRPTLEIVPFIPFAAAKAPENPIEIEEIFPADPPKDKF